MNQFETSLSAWARQAATRDKRMFFGVAHAMSLLGETMSQWKIKHETKTG